MESHSDLYLELLSHLLDLAALLLRGEDLLHHTLLQRREVGVDVLEVVADVLADQEIGGATEADGGRAAVSVRRRSAWLLGSRSLSEAEQHLSVSMS